MMEQFILALSLSLEKQKAAPPCFYVEDEWWSEIFGRKVLINKAPDDSFIPLPPAPGEHKLQKRPT